MVLVLHGKYFFHGLSIGQVNMTDNKIRRGPKLEGYAFANFGNSSGTEGEAAEAKRSEKMEN